MKKIYLILIGLFAYMVPVATVSALTIQQFLKTKIAPVLDAVVILIVGIAFVVFIWGVYQYIVAPGPDEKAKGKNTIIYGILGIFIMISVWGLVGLLTDTFGLGVAAPTDLNVKLKVPR